jgi:hypothetical protein
MRRILIDRARRRVAAKRGAGAEQSRCRLPSPRCRKIPADPPSHALGPPLIARSGVVKPLTPLRIRKVEFQIPRKTKKVAIQLDRSQTLTTTRKIKRPEFNSRLPIY